MNDTLRTIALLEKLHDTKAKTADGVTALVDLCAQLERELNAANAVIATLQTTIESRAAEILKEG